MGVKFLPSINCSVILRGLRADPSHKDQMCKCKKAKEKHLRQMEAVDGAVEEGEERYKQAVRQHIAHFGIDQHAWQQGPYGQPLPLLRSSRASVWARDHAQRWMLPYRSSPQASAWWCCIAQGGTCPNQHAPLVE